MFGGIFMAYKNIVICIYKIRSLTTNRIYIGSAVNFERRKYMHMYSLKRNSHHSIFLQNHVNKHGISDLVFEIIDICNIDELVSKEQFYLDLLTPEFNISKNAYSTIGVKCSDEKKEKLRIIHTGRKATPAAIEANRLGQLKRLPPTQETRLKISQKNTGRWQSDESKIKNSQSQKKRKPVICITNNSEYLSIRDASKKTGIAKELIRYVCEGKYSQTHGFVFKFIQQ